MGAIVTAVIALLTEILPLINTSGTAAKVIAALTQLIPVIVKEVQDLVPMVKNIIAALKDNAVITEEQWAQLDALDAQVDADFESAASQQ